MRKCFVVCTVLALLVVSSIGIGVAYAGNATPVYLEGPDQKFLGTNRFVVVAYTNVGTAGTVDLTAITNGPANISTQPVYFTFINESDTNQEYYFLGFKKN